MKQSLFFCCIIFYSVLAFAQKTSAEVYANLKSRFEEVACADSNGYHLVVQNAKYGVFDLEGKIVIPFEYDRIVALNSQLFRVDQKGKQGILNIHNEWKQALDYLHVSSLRSTPHFFKIRNKEGIGLLDSLGNLVVPTIYEDVVETYQEYQTNYLILKKEDKNALFFLPRAQLLDSLYDGISTKTVIINHDYEEYVYVQNKDNKGLYNKYGEMLLPTEYLSIQILNSRVEPQILAQKQDSSWIVCDEKGKEIFSCNYESLEASLSLGDWMVEGKEGVGLISEKNKVLIPPYYQQLIPLDIDSYIASKPDSTRPIKEEDMGKYDEDYDGEDVSTYGINANICKKTEKNSPNVTHYEKLWGIVNHENKVIVPFIYDHLIPSETAKKYILFYKNNKVGLMDITGKILIPARFEDIQIVETGDKIFAKTDKFWGLYTVEGKQLLKPQFRYFSWNNFLEGYVSIGGKDDKFALFNYRTNQLLTGYEYDNIKYANDAFIVEQNKLFGILDTTGKLLVPCKFNRINVDAYEEYWRATIEKEDEEEASEYIINISENIPVPSVEKYVYPEFLSYENLSFIYKKDEKWGCVSKTGKVLMPFVYDDLHFLRMKRKDNRIVIFTQDSLKTYRYFELTENGTIPYYAPDLIEIEKAKAGKRNAQNQVLIPFEYNYQSPEKYYPFFILIIDRSFGLYDTTGKELVEAKYPQVEKLSMGYGFINWSEEYKLFLNTSKELLSFTGKSIRAAILNGEKYIKLVKNDTTTLYPIDFSLKQKQIVLGNVKAIVHPNLFVAEKNKQEGLIDSLGKVRLAFQYDTLMYITSNLFLAKQKEQFLLIDTLGKSLFNFIGKTKIAEINGLSIGIKDEKKRHYFDLKGKELFPTWKDISFKAMGSFEILSNTKEEVGNLAYYPEYELAVFIFGNDEMQHYKNITDITTNQGDNSIRLSQKVGKKYYEITINDKGEWLKLSNEEFSDNFYNSLILCKIKEKYGLKNIKGEMIVSPIYDAITQFRDGLAVVKKGENCGIIDEKGTIVVPLIYEGLEILSGKEIMVRQNCSSGVMDAKQHYLISTEYDFIEEGKQVYHDNDSISAVNQIFKGTKGTKTLYLNRNNKEIPIADSLSVISYSNTIFVKNKNKKGVINTEGELIIPFIYDGLQEETEGFYKTEKEGMMGLLDNNGNEVFPCKYKYVGYYDGFFYCLQENADGLRYNHQNKKIEPFCIMNMIRR